MPTRRLMHVREMRAEQHFAELRASMATLQAQQATGPAALLETAITIARMQERAATIRDVLTGHKSEHKEAT